MQKPINFVKLIKLVIIEQCEIKEVMKNEKNKQAKK